MLMFVVLMVFMVFMGLVVVVSLGLGQVSPRLWAFFGGGGMLRGVLDVS